MIGKQREDRKWKLFRREDCAWNIQGYSGHTLENGLEWIGIGVEDRISTNQTGGYHLIQVKDDGRLEGDICR